MVCRNMSDYKDFMSDNERFLDRLGYKYIGRDEFEGDPVYVRKITYSEFGDTKYNQTKEVGRYNEGF